MKKTYPIQIQFLAIILLAMLLIAVFIGGFSIYQVGEHVRTSAEELIAVKSEQEADAVNHVFGGMEKSVKMMERYVLAILANEADLVNPEKQAHLIGAADQLFSEIAERTDGALAYYMHFAPNVGNGTAGLFYSKEKGSEGFVRLTPTDLSRYSKEDRERVGWFWVPYEKGSAVWLEPYRNQSSDLRLISYVIPMYVESTFIGVVGMDFDYNALTDRVSAIRIYDNGFAYLEKDGKIAYHKELAEGSPLPEHSLQVTKELKNGMNLVVTADQNDMRKIQYDVGRKLLLLTTGLALLFLLLMFLLIRRLVSPLKKLTKAAEKLAENDYDIEVVHSRTREIELLSTTFEHMTDELREHNRLQHMLAYRDSLTGLRNANSYKAWATDFDQEIKDGPVELFGVMVLDINNLKETNDRFGHDVGNRLIVATAEMIAGIFKRSPVFRIGGDEFIIILQAQDLQRFAALLDKFQAESKTVSVFAEDRNIPVSVAYGTAIFDPDQDESFIDVFNRADDIMYEKKREMKSQSPTDTLENA